MRHGNGLYGDLEWGSRKRVGASFGALRCPLKPRITAVLMRTPPVRGAKRLGWDAPLSRVLSPKRERLVTLRGAGPYLSERVTTVLRLATRSPRRRGR
jgi:hypothetical protein